jgi:hypothetical protein
LHDNSGLTIGEDDNLSSKEETEDEDEEDLLDKSNSSYLSSYFHNNGFSSSKMNPQNFSSTSFDLSSAETSQATTDDHYLPQQTSLPLAMQQNDWWRHNYISQRWRIQQKHFANQEASDRSTSHELPKPEHSSLPQTDIKIRRNSVMPSS